MKKGIWLLLGLLAIGAPLREVMAGTEEWPEATEYLPASAAADAELDGQRAGEGLNPVTGPGGLTASVSRATAVSTNVTTYNVIEGGSFSDSAGIVSVIQNTGNNVIIQDSTVVNVNIMP
jgi:hypothetical protein